MLEWRVLKTSKIVRKARFRLRAVVSAANEVLAASTVLSVHSFKTRHSTYKNIPLQYINRVPVQFRTRAYLPSPPLYFRHS